VFLHQEKYKMTNYDYNRGYRGFKFKKDNKIDTKLPALTNYVSVRENASIHWVSSLYKNHFPRQDNMSSIPRIETTLDDADVSSSIVYFPRIGSTIGGQVVQNYYLHDEDSMEGFLERYSLAPVNTAATLSLRGASVLTASRESRTPYKLPRSEIKSRKKQKHYNKTSKTEQQKRKDLEVYKRDQKLKECLVIHNGVERGERNELLSQEKKEDIADWINKMPSS